VEYGFPEKPGAKNPHGDNSARRDQCGGCWVTGSPTAMAVRTILVLHYKARIITNVKSSSEQPTNKTLKPWTNFN
jgi:hypothetical protein